jgi:hypothetical protein
VENLIRLKINAIEIQPLENNENISLKVQISSSAFDWGKYLG